MAGILVADTIKSSLTTPPVFVNSSGIEVGQLCRAWVKFVGTTGAVNVAYNVSSVTRTAAGVYTIVLLNAMPDANYVVSAWADGGNRTINGSITNASTFTISVYNGGTGTTMDQNCGVAIFR